MVNGAQFSMYLGVVETKMFLGDATDPPYDAGFF